MTIHRIRVGLPTINLSFFEPTITNPALLVTMTILQPQAMYSDHELVPHCARQIIIRVPNTSANVGVGYDCLALTIPLYTTLAVQIGVSDLPHDRPVLTYSGEGANEVSLDPDENLITKVARYVLACHDIKNFPAQTSIHVNCEAPLSRGLGSSACAVIAGVLLADALGQLHLSDLRKLDFAQMIERHPDNIVGALVGGFVASIPRELTPEERKITTTPLKDLFKAAQTGRRPLLPPLNISKFVWLEWNPEIKIILVIPDFKVSTEEARAVVPNSFSKEDCIANLQRVAILIKALGQSLVDPDLIRLSLQDRLHQPYRSHLVPGLSEILSSMTPNNQPGLLGVCLSGAGPTLLALATHNFKEIGETIVSKWSSSAGIKSDWKMLSIDETGAHVHQSNL